MVHHADIAGRDESGQQRVVGYASDSVATYDRFDDLESRRPRVVERTVHLDLGTFPEFPARWQRLAEVDGDRRARQTEGEVTKFIGHAVEAPAGQHEQAVD